MDFKYLQNLQNVNRLAKWIYNKFNKPMLCMPSFWSDFFEPINGFKKEPKAEQACNEQKNDH